MTQGTQGSPPVSRHTPGPWRAHTAQDMVPLGEDPANWHGYAWVGFGRETSGRFDGVLASLDRRKDASKEFRGRADADARLIAAATILPDLYASEINARVEWFWDGWFDVSLGDVRNGWKDRANFEDWIDVLEWLRDAACRHYPDSDFAKRYANATGTQP